MVNYNVIYDFLCLIVIFSFFKTILLGLIFELIWPTHFFNKKNNINFSSKRLRSFNENLIKFFNPNDFYLNYYFVFFKFFFLNRFVK
uniref:ymf56 n=1 Tax=Cryptocaryon irritans TaxID=153251 RepID=UPI0022FD4964|nr:ymf56 [Cryptocaryon irritans]WBP62332.1 ymf56 [Cryptocaryon irritans]